MPERIQRKRTRGWRMPEGAVYVGRPTKYGNPFVVGSTGFHLPDGGSVFYRGGYATAQARVDLYQKHILPTLDLSELRGKDLACWCKLGAPCHVDPVLEWANR